MPDHPPPGALKFGDFVLDAAAYELRRLGRPVRLERLAMDLLLLLLSHRGELVTRAEIVERLWGRDVFLDVDASVNTLVRKIRRALRDTVEHPRYLQTVQGKGYRFIAPVEEVLPVRGNIASAVAEPSPPMASPAPTAWSYKALTPGRRSAGILAIAVLLAFAWWAWFPSRTAAGPVIVAVMPFQNLGGNPDLQYLADGFTDETSASLGQIIDPRRVRIIGRIATATYRGTTRSAAEIGRELRAEYLVGGSVQAENGRVRLTASLTRVRDRLQVWSESYDREPLSLLTIQQQLGAAVAREIRLQLSSDRLSALSQRQTRNPATSDLYMQGRSLWEQLTPASTRSAMGVYLRATHLEPGYALAWSGLADAWATGPIHSDIQPASVEAHARDATARALQAGDKLAETHTSEGVRQFFLGWDWPGSEAAFQRAIELNPNYSMAHRNYGVLLSHSGRAAAARIQLAMAREIDREYVMNHVLSAMIEFHAGQNDAALGHAQRALLLDPTFWIAHYQLAQAYEQKGRGELALEALANTSQGANDNSKIPALRGYILARLGRVGPAREELALLERLSATRYVPPYARALIYAGLGERDLTFEWLGKAFDAHDVHLVFYPSTRSGTSGATIRRSRISSSDAISTEAPRASSRPDAEPRAPRSRSLPAPSTVNYRDVSLLDAMGDVRSAACANQVPVDIEGFRRVDPGELMSVVAKRDVPRNPLDSRKRAVRVVAKESLDSDVLLTAEVLPSPVSGRRVGVGIRADQGAAGNEGGHSAEAPDRLAGCAGAPGDLRLPDTFQSAGIPGEPPGLPGSLFIP